MEKYLIILIIIIILYHIQKYCIKSEIQTFLLTKNIIEKFTVNNSSLSGVLNSLIQTGGLDLSGNLIINNRHKLTSDGNYLKLTDVNGQNFLNLAVNNLDVNGDIILRQNTFNSSQGFRFVNSNNGTLLIDNINYAAGLKSLQGPLNINASSNIINLSGNTDILGDFRINNIKPILVKIINISNSNNIDTGISSSVYSGIAFSGYTTSTRTYANTFEFNTYKQNGNWFISFTPPRPPTGTTPLGVRLTFFHVNFVGDEGIIEGTVAPGQTTPTPVPVPESKPVPVPESKPVPVPESKPVPAPESKPVLVPVPESKPVPVPESKPVPIPESKPVPVPESKPVPVPESKPVPVPVPESKPILESKPEVDYIISKPY
jgi:hypothetical protein